MNGVPCRHHILFTSVLKSSNEYNKQRAFINLGDNKDAKKKDVPLFNKQVNKLEKLNNGPIPI